MKPYEWVGGYASETDESTAIALWGTGIVGGARENPSIRIEPRDRGRIRPIEA
jgi:hypothetical protein